MKPDDTDIESALVDALEVELEDYQCASESWTAVRMAIDGLRRRDARIEQLEKALAEACAIADASELHEAAIEWRRRVYPDSPRWDSDGIRICDAALVHATDDATERRHRVAELRRIGELAGEDLDKALEAALAKYKAQPSGN